MKVVTFNIRTLWDRDGINSFIHRIGLIYDKINAELPEVIAFQEVTEKHIDVLRKLFPDYSFVGCGRHENRDGEGIYTAYLKSQIGLLKERVFWLSDTPDVPGSRFKSQSIYPRICVYTLFKRKDDEEELGFYNVHLDYIGTVGHTAPPSKDEIPEDFDFDNIINPRLLAVNRVLLEIEKDVNKDGIIILGDFNAVMGDECLARLYEEGYVDVSESTGPTFHNFGKGDKNIKIDYIFANYNLAKRAYNAHLWLDQKNGIYLSDHYPTVIEIN